MSVAVITENLVFGEILSTVCRERKINVLGIYESSSSVKWLHSGDLLLVHMRVDDFSAPEQLLDLKSRFGDIGIVFLISDRLSTQMIEALKPLGNVIIPERENAEALISALTLAELGYQISALAAPEEAVQNAQPKPNSTPSNGDPGPSLSKRELTILKYLCDGLSNKIIARELGINETTVKVHLRSAYRKIGVSNRTQAALWTSREYSA